MAEQERRARRAEGAIRQGRQVGDPAAVQQLLRPGGVSAERADGLVRAVRDGRDRS